MKPYGRERNIKGFKGKTDVHPKKLGKGWGNWWEFIIKNLSRGKMNHDVQKQINNDLNEEE